MPVSLPDVTLVAIDCAAHELTREALRDTLGEIDPAEVLVWSDRPIGLGIDVLPCNNKGPDDASRVLWYEVPKRVTTSHFLLIQWDSWALDGKLWRPGWLTLDYIGAPFPGGGVGNGGFSLRSTAIARYLAANRDRFPYDSGNEDHVLCRWFRSDLEGLGFRWASEADAAAFAFEWTNRSGPAFGFHGMFNWPLVLDRERLRGRIALATDYIRGRPGWSEVLAAAGLMPAPSRGQTTTDPDLHLRVAGERIEPASIGDRVYTFELASPPTGPVLLSSRTGVPAELGVNRDTRRLGVAVNRIELRQARAAITFGHDAALFRQLGCYAPERGFSWTNGAMLLPAWMFAQFAGPLSLTVQIDRNGMRYPLSEATVDVPEAEPPAPASTMEEENVAEDRVDQMAAGSAALEQRMEVARGQIDHTLGPPEHRPAPDEAADSGQTSVIYEELLNALYRVVLLREPDPDRFGIILRELKERKRTIEQLMRAAFVAPEFAANLLNFIRRYVPSAIRQDGTGIDKTNTPSTRTTSPSADPIEFRGFVEEPPPRPSSLTKEEKLARIRSVRWFHCMDFGDGLYTHDEQSAKAMLGKANTTFRYPVNGKTVLDIGAWDGYFSFEAERRGASRVLATDHFCWSGDGWGTKAGFDLAHELLGSRVEALDIDIPQIAPETVGMFDIVLCMGVLYHVWDPLRVLKIVHSVTKELAIIESALDLEGIDRPALSFVRGHDMPRPDVPLSNDPTNFYGPNAKAIIAMLEYIGFSRIETHIVAGASSRGFFYAFR